MHPSERAAQLRELGWNRDLGVEAVPPHTSQEWEALEAIDQARADEARELRTRGHRPVVRLA